MINIEILENAGQTVLTGWETQPGNHLIPAGKRLTAILVGICSTICGDPKRFDASVDRFGNYDREFGFVAFDGGRIYTSLITLRRLDGTGPWQRLFPPRRGLLYDIYV